LTQISDENPAKKKEEVELSPKTKETIKRRERLYNI
jgi:hypothetical protein